MELGKRLKALADAVRPGVRVADIGADHARLPVYLVQTGVCPAAVAVDIQSGPVAVARRAVAAAGLREHIAVRRGDGLAPVRPDEAEDIIIAGMGGETIAAILAAADWVRSDRCRLILQPMTRVQTLHRFLYENGFAILQEHMVEEDGRGYVYLIAVFAALPPQTDAFTHWRGGFTGDEGRPYWQKSAAHLARQADGCAASDPARAAALRALSDRLRAL